METNRIEVADQPVQCPYKGRSIKQLEGVDPYPDFAAMLAAGDMRFDDSLGAWVAVSYEACQQIFRNDKLLFTHPDADPGADYAEIAQGRRHAKTLFGEEHSRLHRWLALRFSPRQTSELRTRLIEDVVSKVIDGFAQSGVADLAADFADNIPIRVIAGALDLPWQDPNWNRHAKSSLDQIGEFYNKRMAGDPELTKRAKTAFADMRTLLDSVIEERRNGVGEDIVSQMWRDGPSLLEGWDAEDVFINILALFIGGYDTTTMAISNACKLMLDDPDLMASVRDGDETRLKRFVEESLRLLPPVQYRVRRAEADVDLSGHHVKKGDFIVPLIAAANRDPGHYACTGSVDLDGQGTTDHLTFISGPRMCIGAGLARTEIAEAIRLLLRRLPDIRYDAARREPTYRGLVMRRFSPLHVEFTPEGPPG